ncbi:P27 family phage terminase small subunit [Variovorax ginsengisoli]|uniref:P27 family phage terminase small subunit n=1 Tax=Variovorax ginsengisoli TaxID=363844 RepID=A0ABT8S6V7_9BURK|nr:P27 family phage terminase small subunit [Variovorax ginsengisoli]MDN8615488.1 P27 family phage terminase small subunit [Variovorax ginsengisoli]MDO1534658.1 P27 family phage terminase small subunit [Variovorax ginsengisoli]
MPAHRKGSTISTGRRVQPMTTLSPPALAVFKHIVASVDPSHFSAVDLPLLESYANHAAMATHAAQQIDAEGAVVAGKPSPWLTVQEKAVKALTALSARLRIAPQSRFDRLVAGANSRQQLNTPKPWEQDIHGLLAGEDEDPGERYFRSAQ